MQKTNIIVFFLFCFSSLLYSAVSPYFFSSLKLEEGLSQLTVIKILQDRKGFMWFATRNGLNRYDGTSFTVYKHNNSDSLSLSNNHVTALAEDKYGTLWIGTMNGLNRLELSEDRMISYNGLPDAQQIPVYKAWVSALYVDSRDQLWVGIGSGLYRYDYETKTFLPVFLGDELKGQQIMVIREDRHGNLLVGTSGKGLYVCDPQMNILAHYSADTASDMLTGNHISAAYEDDFGHLWIGTRGAGLNRIDMKTRQVTRYTEANSELNHNAIRTIEPYNGKLVIGTFNGLNLVDPETCTFSKFINFDEHKGGLSHFSVFSSYVDKANTLWIGTYAGGISYNNSLNNRFSFYDLRVTSHLYFGIFAMMAYQPDHTLWIASEGRGLLSFDLETETFDHFLLDPSSNIQPRNERNMIKSVLMEDNVIWCGTQLGTLYKFDTKTKKFTLFYSFNKEVSIYTINRCSDGLLWLGTTDSNGITFLDAKGNWVKKDSISTYFPSVRSFQEIRKGVYLVGTHAGGLICYSSETGKHEIFGTIYEGNHKLFNDQVTCIEKDQSGRIWVGTYGGGFCLFDEEKGIVDWLTTSNGLSDDNISSIIAGNDGKIWLSTGNGISAYDPESRLFTNYIGKSEIPVNEFSLKGGIKLPDGRIFFSGSNGIVSFYPDKLKENRFIPPVVLTTLTVNNKSILPGDASGILDKTLDYTSRFVLDHNQNNFSIGYAALSYLFSNQNRYAYKLEGYDTDWNDAGSRKEAFYTNLKPGHYVFHVRAANNDGVWNDAGVSVSIYIKTPLWQTWYAYLIYSCIIGGVFYVIYYYLHMKRKLERDLIEKQKEQQRQEEFHQSKIRLFTNFSHELRTPLMLILSPLDEVLQRVDMNPGLKATLRLVYGNAQRLLLLVNQLMDLRKNQSGNLQLRVSHDDLYLFVQEIYIAFNQIAAKEQITFRLESEESQVEAWFDRALLEKVVFNLLSNAFKHTVPGESVVLHLQSLSAQEVQEQFAVKADGALGSSSRYVCLSVEDTGKGIDDSDKLHIFAPFYQGADESELNTTGTGIGLSLVLSIVKLHKGVVWVEDNHPKGAIFRVLIPVDKEIYAEEQLAEDMSPAKSSSDEMEETNRESESVSLDSPDIPADGRRYTVLLAEDNPDVRRYIKSRLEMYYQVLEAENGAEAFDKITNTLPDLVISDIMMPKKDGLQLCAEIKQDLRTGHIPVIIITAKSMVMHIKEGFQCGADDYIVKPFNMDVLLSRIRNILASRERLKELYGKKFSLESLGIETTSADDRFMQKLFEVIEQNIANPELNVDVLCKGVGMGRANLYRKLKAITDLSPVDLIRNKRLEVGARMLLETDMNVSEVSVNVGFNSHAYFATCFKSMFGMSPTDYVGLHNDR